MGEILKKQQSDDDGQLTSVDVGQSIENLNRAFQVWLEEKNATYNIYIRPPKGGAMSVLDALNHHFEGWPVIVQIEPRQ